MRQKTFLLTLFFALLALYCLYQARFLVFGPGISLASPRDEAVLSNPVVEVTGVARNAAWLTLDGSPIFTDQKGNFSEKLLVATGTSIIELNARDRFGREAMKTIRVTLE